jgi:hypothetical protein
VDVRVRTARLAGASRPSYGHYEFREVLYNTERELTLRWAAGPAPFGLHLTLWCEYVARATPVQVVRVHTYITES